MLGKEFAKNRRLGSDNFYPRGQLNILIPKGVDKPSCSQDKPKPRF